MDETTPRGMMDEKEKEEGMEQVHGWCYRMQRLLPSLIIVCMAIYEIAKALLKTSARLHIQRLSCLYITKDSKLCRHEPNKTVVDSSGSQRTTVVLFVAIHLFIKETITYDPHKIMDEQMIKAYAATRRAEAMGVEDGEDHTTKNGPYSRTEDFENAMLVPPGRKELTGMCFTVAHIICFLSRKRDRCDRAHIIILLLCCFINHMAKVGENDAMLLYVACERVWWNDKIYGAYLSASYVAMSLQLLVVYTLLERLFNPSDKTCIIFGASVRILTFTATGLTNKTPLLFVYGLLGSFGAFGTCAGRSNLTKLTSEEEVGTMLALTSFLEVLSATVGSSLFTEIFVSTQKHFAGTVFFILAALQESDAAHEALDRPIQKKAAPFIIGYRVLLNLPAMFVCLVLGSWSDQNGRKGPMILPIVGACLACCFFGISLIPGYPSIPFQMAWVLAGALLYGLCGKSNALGMGAHSYITDCSTEAERTPLIGRLLGTNFVGLCIGSLLVTVFYYFSSYGWVLLFVTAFNLGILILLIILVRDSLAVSPSKSPSSDYGSMRMLEYPKHQKRVGEDIREVDEGNFQKLKGEVGKKCGCWKTVRTSLRESWVYIAKMRPNGHHVYIRILLGAVLFNQVTKAGEQDSLLLFVVRQDVGWSDGIYGAYLATYYASMAFNLIFIFPIVEQLFQPSDISLILFGLFMKTVRLLGTALTTDTVLIFVFAVIGSPAGYTISALRSLITKLADSGEVGTSFAIMSVLETLANLFGSIVFTSVYAATVTVFPGSIFIIDACLHAGMFALTVWLGWRLRNMPTFE
ncbi:Major facilitator superfamily locus tagral substrate transporter [Echinococcus multilocularis]|uniref:Major facilitator superfamily locus tagral substrate transporter n=1 Tax=Echinococcus multilocularis TaxID=6211 RepID=A0A068Y686_ECHMU|nr:Major facilitator superfamily locus tagral substrate transporter [Echinococcus multilocularis]